MSTRLSETERTNQLNSLATALNAGGGAKILLYSGSKPASKTGTPSGTLLRTFNANASFFSSTSGNVGTAAVPIANVDTAAGGASPGLLATWARITNNAGTFIMDVDAGTNSQELIVSPSAQIITGATITITSLTITPGGA